MNWKTTTYLENCTRSTHASATWSISESDSLVVGKCESDRDCSLLLAIIGPSCIHTSYLSILWVPNIARSCLFFGHRIEIGCVQITATKSGCRQSASNAALQFANIVSRASSISESVRDPAESEIVLSVNPQIYMQRSISRKPESRTASQAASFTCASSTMKSRRGDTV